MSITLSSTDGSIPTITLPIAGLGAEESTLNIAGTSYATIQSEEGITCRTKQYSDEAFIRQRTSYSIFPYLYPHPEATIS